MRILRSGILRWLLACLCLSAGCLVLVEAPTFGSDRVGSPGAQKVQPAKPGHGVAEAAPEHRRGRVPTKQARAVEDFGKLPLRFEANSGQTDAQVRFLSRGRDYTLFLTGNEAVLSLRKPSASSSQLPVASRQQTETRNSKLENQERKVANRQLVSPQPPRFCA